MLNSTELGFFPLFFCLKRPADLQNNPKQAFGVLWVDGTLSLDSYFCIHHFVWISCVFSFGYSERLGTEKGA